LGLLMVSLQRRDDVNMLVVDAAAASRVGHGFEAIW